MLNNGVTVLSLAQATGVFNLAFNDVPSANWQLNVEAVVTANVGLGGVAPGSTPPVTGSGATGVPLSLGETPAFGFPRKWRLFGWL